MLVKEMGRTTYFVVTFTDERGQERVIECYKDGILSDDFKHKFSTVLNQKVDEFFIDPDLLKTDVANALEDFNSQLYEIQDTVSNVEEDLDNIRDNIRAFVNELDS